MAYRVLITGAGGPGAVNLTRSLLMEPDPCFTVGCDASRYYVHLALTHERRIIPPASDTVGYLTAINRLVEQHDIQLIVPGNSIEMEVLATNVSSLLAPCFIPRLATLQAAASKWESYKIFRAAGIPVPSTLLIESREDITEVFDTIATRPVWIRGAGIPGRGIGVAALPCRTVEQACGWVDYFDGWGGMCASEYLPGDNLTWLGIFDQGELIVSQGRKRIAYVIPHVSPSGITGAPAVSHTIHRDDINRIGLAAVLAIDEEMTGVCFVDLKCDGQDRPHVTEINAGRFGTTSGHFYAAAGVNFPKILVEVAIGGQRPDLPRYDVLPENLYWIRTIDCGPVLLTEEEIATRATAYRVSEPGGR